MGHADLPELQAAIAGTPDRCSSLTQAGISLGLQPKVQLPELAALGGHLQLQHRPSRSHLTGDGLTPVGCGADQPLAVLIVEGQHPIAGSEGLLPAL